VYLIKIKLSLPAHSTSDTIGSHSTIWQLSPTIRYTLIKELAAQTVSDERFLSFQQHFAPQHLQPHASNGTSRRSICAKD
jgi:hypothetical protein